MALQKIGKEDGHLSALGAALTDLVLLETRWGAISGWFPIRLVLYSERGGSGNAGARSVVAEDRYDG
jgi:hypothetical protein